MATFYISYKMEDSEIVETLKPLLEEKGHSVRYDRELGSAWGQHVWTCPLLARGANQRHIPDPIRDLSPLSLQDAGECRQLLDDMAGFTSLKRSGSGGSEIFDKIQTLVKASSEAPHDGSHPESDGI